MTIEDRIEMLHQSNTMVYLVCTGAGAGCQNMLARISGASATILECLFPYSGEALADFIGEVPKQYASEDTAFQMAAHARRRGMELAIRSGKNPAHVIGVGVTAAIATNRPLKGDHRVFIAVADEKGFFLTHVVFAKKNDSTSALGRLRESELCDWLTLNAILTCAGIKPIELPLSFMEVRFCGLKEGQGSADVESISPEKHVLFPGSFNPLHFGHEHMAKAASLQTGKKVVYLINKNHPDKGVLGDEEIIRRVSQFDRLAQVHVTSDMNLYVDKAKAFPGFTFVVGADTLERLLDPRYGISTESVLDEFAQSQTHFLVADRSGENGAVTLGGIRKSIPCEYQYLFESLSVMIPVSSTQLRTV